MSTCKICHDPLEVELETDEEAGGSSSAPPAETVPDDLELPCGCHFHWQCLLDQSPQIAVSLSCPSCGTYLPSNQAGPSVTNSFRHISQSSAIATTYTNEGGRQEGLDILPLVTEEAYLAAHPEARPARAMLIMCAEGDVTGIVEMLQDVESDPDAGMAAAALLRYQDPLDGGKSALHVAVGKDQEEVFWLLLWLASSLPVDVFPTQAVQAAEAMGVQKAVVAEADDIRRLKDEQGKTAGDLASAAGGIWTALAEGGLL